MCKDTSWVICDLPLAVRLQFMQYAKPSPFLVAWVYVFLEKPKRAEATCVFIFIFHFVGLRDGWWLTLAWEAAYIQNSNCTILVLRSWLPPDPPPPLFLCETAEKCGAPCTTDQFTCDNGCCLDPGLECDLTPQCSDGSDEETCEDCK